METIYGRVNTRRLQLAFRRARFVTQESAGDLFFVFCFSLLTYPVWIVDGKKVGSFFLAYPCWGKSLKGEVT